MTNYLKQNNASSRVVLIDAVRGFALFGLFMVHCVEVFELYWANPVPSELRDQTLSIFAGKSFALFALCFGLSFAIIMDSASKRGEAYGGRFLWRLALLAVIGYGHSLIYRGDILVPLAVLGVILVPLNRISKNWILLLIAALFMLNLPLLWRILAGLNGAEWAMSMPHYYNDYKLSTYLSGTFAETINANAITGNLKKWSFYIESGRVSQILGLFIFGQVLGRIGFFRNPQRFRRETIGIFLLTTIITFILLNWHSQLVSLFQASEAGSTDIYVDHLLKSWSDSTFMAAQVAAFVLIWQFGGHYVLKAFAAGGRMTLSLYVGQSLVMVPILYGFGFGLHDDLTSVHLFWIGLGGFAFQLVLAAIWMRFFQYGPLEWVWRAATQLNLNVPFLRRTKQSEIG
ncbi:MAG: DUF418 domain-containing protein [Henriciella sp.]|nr:DUF418 domain-containing protein [Henriciella sp.]